MRIDNKLIYRRILLIISILLCLGISACGSDDKQEVVNEDDILKSKIVGTWVYDMPNPDDGLIFYEDGGGSYFEEYNYGRPLHLTHFSWTLKSNILTIKYPKEIEIFTVESVNMTMMYFTDSDGYEHWMYKM